MKYVVPVAQLDKASDYESEDWGFESLQGYFLGFILQVHTEIPVLRLSLVFPKH